ncbi:MAG: methylated-DNA--[protein]-cysteine S-methyltransferase [Planctomycetaceae bacterium]|nr:methylated-DNA--[protein]-cysteine S-methyltransferase [Planctomycetaceae bacterium]
MPIASEVSTELVEVATLPTEMDWFGFAVANEKILVVTIGDRSENAARRRLKQKLSRISRDGEIVEGTSTLVQRLQQDLQRFTSGEAIDFRNYDVCSDHLTDFQKRVLDAVRKIPCGETLSYAEVAERAGSPRAARAVGNVMANNRTPIVVPCHRVLASGGKWGGFTAPGGVNFKRRLLALEANH